jgi:hypothetical protein
MHAAVRVSANVSANERASVDVGDQITIVRWRSCQALLGKDEQVANRVIW